MWNFLNLKSNVVSLSQGMLPLEEPLILLMEVNSDYEGHE